MIRKIRKDLGKIRIDSGRFWEDWKDPGQIYIAMFHNSVELFTPRSSVFLLLLQSKSFLVNLIKSSSFQPGQKK